MYLILFLSSLNAQPEVKTELTWGTLYVHFLQRRISNIHKSQQHGIRNPHGPSPSCQKDGLRVPPVSSIPLPGTDVKKEAPALQEEVPSRGICFGNSGSRSRALSKLQHVLKFNHPLRNVSPSNHQGVTH